MTDRDEIIWEGKPSQWINFKPYCFCALMVLCIVLAMTKIGLTWWLLLFLFYPAGRALFEWANLHFVSYKLTNDRFIHKEGVFNRITKELKPTDILSVRLVEPWYERMVKLGDIELILNPYLDISLKIRGIPDAENVCKKIDKMRLENKEKTEN